MNNTQQSSVSDLSKINTEVIEPLKCYTHCQIIGFGPACLSLLIAADRLGVLVPLLEKGLIIHEKSVDKNTLLKSGINYSLPSNSDALDFLSGISKKGLFASVLSMSAAKIIYATGKNGISLQIVAMLIEDIRQCFIDLSTRYVNSHILYNSQVESIDQEAQLWSLRTSNRTAITEIMRTTTPILQPKNTKKSETQQTHYTHRIVSPNIVMASGSYPYIPQEISQYCEHNNITLLHSEQVLRENNLIVKVTAQESPIVIIGASHSGFSVLHQLLSQHSGSQQNIKIIHRSMIRRMHLSIPEAIAAGESFNQDTDICPENGRVFRFQGLYKRSKRLFEDVKNNHYPFVSLHQYIQKEGITQHIQNASIIVSATGYRPMLPVIRDSQQHTINFIKQGSSLSLNNNGNLCDIEGTPIAGLMAIGLGFGRKHGGIGEPSYLSAPVGINIFQGADGEAICQQLNATTLLSNGNQYEEKLI